MVQVISGALNPAQQQQFLNDYAALFGAVAIIEVGTETLVWIGGTYDAEQGFLPPIQPEVIDGTATLMPTEQPIELQEQV